MSEAIMRPPGSGRGTLVLIVGLLILPFVIGGALYVGGWQPPRTATHGQLLSPPQPLPDELLRATGKIRGKWMLLLNVSGACESQCAGRIDEMRRVQVALYKNMGRLSRVVLTDQPNDPMLTELQRTQPDLLVVIAPSRLLAGSEGPQFLADPQGQLVMTYPPGATAQGVRADLERLLKFTSTG
jgi:hypothetical protein